MNPVVYIFLNKSLHMSAGKLAAQAAHAAMMVWEQKDESVWLKSPHRTIICLEARDAEHIRNIQEYLKDRGFDTNLIIDEGVNEIDPHVPTALSTHILNKDDENVQLSFSSFDLYRDDIKVTLEFRR